MSTSDEQYSPIIEHYDTLQKYCRYLSKNKWDYEDLVQEAVTKAYATYRDQAMISKSLLKKIAYNQYIDWARKSRYELVDASIVEEKESAEMNLSHTLEALELLLNHVTLKQAVIFVLKDVFLFQSKEIALLLATNETAVKASLHRTKRKLSHLDCEKRESAFQEEEYEQVKELLLEAIEQQDPTVLIQYIHSLLALKPMTMPKTISNTPTLSMVA